VPIRRQRRCTRKYNPWMMFDCFGMPIKKLDKDFLGLLTLFVIIIAKIYFSIFPFPPFFYRSLQLDNSPKKCSLFSG
jgi:hypothetical protein